MKPAPFDYVRPNSIEEALELLAALPNAKVLAGGQSLVSMLNMRFVQPDNIVDVSRLNLNYVRLSAERLTIGATTLQRDIEMSPLVHGQAPLFVEALRNVGHVQTRNRGTIGGSLCHMDPSAELPAVCMAVDADIIVRSAQRGERRIPMRNFVAGYMTPAIEPDELVTEIEVPIWPSGHGFAFKEFARRHGDFAIASAAVLVDMAHGKINRASIVIGGLDVAPTRSPEAEEKLVGRTPIEIDVLDAAFPCGSIDAGSDAQAGSEYRKQLARVMAARAIEQALERAQPKDIR